MSSFIRESEELLDKFQKVQHNAVFLIRQLNAAVVYVANVIREFEEIIDKGDNIIAKSLTAIVHRDNRVRLYLFCERMRSHSVYRIITAYRDEQHIDFSELGKLLVREHVSEIAEVRHSEIFSLDDGYAVLSAERALRIVMEAVKPANLECRILPAESDTLGVVMIRMLVAAKDSVGRQRGERQPRNAAGCIWVKNCTALIRFEQEA